MVNVGDVLETKTCGTLTVKKIHNDRSVTVKFHETCSIIKVSTKGQVLSGSVKDYYSRSVCGVGYLGVKHAVKVYGRESYNTWKWLINICYNPNHPSFNGRRRVCYAWHNFKNFAEWRNSQVGEVFTKNLEQTIYCPYSCKKASKYEKARNVSKRRMQVRSITDGANEYHFDNVRKFSLDNNLDYHYLIKLLSGKISKYKGFYLLNCTNWLDEE